MMNVTPVEILLVEDSPGMARLTKEVFKDARMCNNINVVVDGEEAMAYLRKEREYAEAVLPDIILLDLNMPKKDGREVLAEIKADRDLKHIPVLIYSASSSEKDIRNAYELQANAFITKPLNLDEFIAAVRTIGEFWLCIAKLPPRGC